MCLFEFHRGPEVSVTPLALRYPWRPSAGRSLNRQPAISLSTRGPLIKALRKPTDAQRTNRNTPITLVHRLQMRPLGRRAAPARSSLRKKRKVYGNLPEGEYPCVRGAKHAVCNRVSWKLNAAFQKESLGDVQRRKTVKLQIRHDSGTVQDHSVARERDPPEFCRLSIITRAKGCVV